MLKHVHASTSSLSSYRFKSPSRDTVSLTSTISYGSSGGQEALSSRSSSSSSLHDSDVRLARYVVKVYARVLCSDMEYKTLSIQQETTSKDVVRTLLNKFKMKHRDPNLFYLTMEVWMRKKGVPVRSVIVLDDEAHPAELQACHPRGDSKFCLQMRRGGLIKVYGSCLMAGALYKSLLVSERTTVDELIQLVLHCYCCQERATKFALYEVSADKNYERKLHIHEYPLLIQKEWPITDHYSFHLRRNIDDFQSQLPWMPRCEAPRRAFHWTPQRSRSIAFPPSSLVTEATNDYENCFYI